MASETEIANWAIIKMGGDRVLSMGDDTPTGRLMTRLFPLVRNAELQRGRWRFAIKRAQLLADATAPEWGYAYAYTLPADYLALVQAGEFYVRTLSKSQAPWSIEGRKLLTDINAPLRTRYVSLVTDAGQFHPLFVECLACKLAAEAIVSLKQNAAKLRDLKDSYMDALISAAGVDALESPPDELPLGTWLEAREGAFGSISGNDPFNGSSGFSVI